MAEKFVSVTQADCQPVIFGKKFFRILSKFDKPLMRTCLSHLATSAMPRPIGHTKIRVDAIKFKLEP